jgi:CheY-like chemotaxis protein
MNVLCVDDNNLVRSVTCDMLRELGHDVTDVSDGAAAVEHIRQCGTRLELLMTDIQMPGLSGWDVVAAARHLYPEMPVLYFTAYAGTEPLDDEQTMLLRKPCSINSIERAIETLCPSRLLH